MILLDSGTLARTVGGKKYPDPSGETPPDASVLPAATASLTLSSMAATPRALVIGPMVVAGSRPLPTTRFSLAATHFSVNTHAIPLRTKKNRQSVVQGKTECVRIETG